MSDTREQQMCAGNGAHPVSYRVCFQLVQGLKAILGLCLLLLRSGKGTSAAATEFCRPARSCKDRTIGTPFPRAVPLGQIAFRQRKEKCCQEHCGQEQYEASTSHRILGIIALRLMSRCLLGSMYPFSYGWEKTLLVQPAVAPEAQLPLVTEWLRINAFPGVVR